VSDALNSPSLFDKSRRPFLLRKLHSLTGVLPVGGFMVFHLWTNAKALQGQERFDGAVADITHMPYLPVMEAGILLPLLFHAVYGIKLMLESRANVARNTPYSRNWMYTFQRTSMLARSRSSPSTSTSYWWQKVTGKLAPDQFYTELCADACPRVGPVPGHRLVYILGIAACTFHFANGLWGFCFSWGITVSRRSQQLAATVFGVAGIAALPPRRQHRDLLRHRRPGRAPDLPRRRHAREGRGAHLRRFRPRGRGAPPAKAAALGGPEKVQRAWRQRTPPAATAARSGGSSSSAAASRA
jgi:succinate dehydrogenase / fumarate reductase cytochrome b subunit